MLSGTANYVPSPAHALPPRRQVGQATGAERQARDLRAELEEKERKHSLKMRSVNFEGGGGAQQQHWELCLVVMR